MTTNINRLKQKGFTVIELLIVVVIIGVLAGIVVVVFVGAKDRAENSALQSDLVSANRKLELFRAEYGAYPTSLDASYCPVPTDDDYCLKPSEGNTFSNYSVNNAASPPTYSLNVVSGNGKQYYIASNGNPSTSSDTFTMAAISGTIRTGFTISAGALTPSGATVNRQWQRGTSSSGPFTNISGATGSTFAIPTTDRGNYLRVVATGTGTYSGTVTSAPTAMVTTAITAIGAISGTATQGQTLTAGAITPAGATVAYQWRRAGVAISGATGSTYVVTAADVGSTITVVATGTGTYSQSVTSAATATVN